jgi:methyl-accepting chemotaxis protein
MLQTGTHPHFLHKKPHDMNLKFSHKILLAASGVVVLAFALFTLYNDYLQRSTIRQNLESSVQQAGDLTASSVQNWMSGRVLVLENLAQNIAHQGANADLPGLVDQPTLTSNFQFTYVGQTSRGRGQNHADPALYGRCRRDGRDHRIAGEK